MDRTVILLLASLLLAGVAVAQNRNSRQLRARLNNTGIFHNRLNSSSWSLGKQSGQQIPRHTDHHRLSIGGSSSSQESPQNPSRAPVRPLNWLIDNALSRFNANSSRPSLPGQNVGRYIQQLANPRGTAQNSGEQPQSGLFGGRPLDGFAQSLGSFSSSRPSIIGQNSLRDPRRLRGFLRTLQNTGGQPQGELFRQRLSDRFDNSILPRFNSSRSSIFGQNYDRIQQHNGDPTEASRNIQTQSGSQGITWSRFIIPALSRINGGSSSPTHASAQHGAGSDSAESSGYSASGESGDRSATSSDENGSSGGNSS